MKELEKQQRVLILDELLELDIITSAEYNRRLNIINDRDFVEKYE